MHLYKNILQIILIPIMGKAKVFPQIKKINELKCNFGKSKDEIGNIQLEKLQKLVQHSYHTVPYYREVFDKLQLKPEDIKCVEDLNKLPFLTREIIQSKFPNDISSSELNAYKVIKKSSSGSTGEPLKRYTTKEAVSEAWGSLLRAWQWCGYEFGDKVLLIWGDEEYYRKYSGIRKLAMQILRWKLIPSYCVDLKEMNTIIGIIRNFKPKVIRGYTPSIDTIAMYMQYNKINDIRVDIVIITGATMTDEIKKRLEKVFHCKVYNEYGADGMIIAFQCPECGRMHTLDENIVFEADHFSASALSAGEDIAEVVVTDLNNYAMPLIRYKVGDLYTNQKKAVNDCNGYGMFQNVVGRTTDRIVTPNGKVIIYFDFLFEGIVDNIEKYMIIQENEYLLNIQVVLIDEKLNWTEEYLNQIISDNLAKRTGDNMKVKIEIKTQIELVGTWKRRHIVSTFYSNSLLNYIK